MTKPMHKSGTFRKVKRKTPGARVSLLHKKRKPSQAKCRNCGAKLAAVPRDRPYKMATMPKTKKRPERPYGGNLCSKCMRSTIKSQTRAQE